MIDQFLNSLDCIGMLLALVGSAGTGLPAIALLAKRISNLKNVISVTEDQKTQIEAVVLTLIKSVETYSKTLEKPDDNEDVIKLKEWIQYQAAAHGTEQLLHLLVKKITQDQSIPAPPMEPNQ